MEQIIQQIVSLFNLETQIQFSALHILGKYRNQQLLAHGKLSVIAALIYLLHKLYTRAQDRKCLSQYCQKISIIGTVKQRQIIDIESKIIRITKWKLAQPTLWDYFLIFAFQWDKFTTTNSITKIKFMDPSCPTLLALSNNYCLQLVRNLELYQYLQSDDYDKIKQQKWKQLSLVFLWVMIVTQSRQICKQSKFLPYRSTVYIFRDFLSQLIRNKSYSHTCQFEQYTEKLLSNNFFPVPLSTCLEDCFSHRKKYSKTKQYFNYVSNNR